MNPPTATQLVAPPPLTLDEGRVLRNFLGKTQQQAQAMFPRDSTVTEDFTYMTPAGLCYYLPPALAYLASPEAQGDWDFAHGLMCALSTQAGLHHVRGEALHLIQQIAEYCATQRPKFILTEEDELFDRYLDTIRRAVEEGKA